ncbi:MAG TPA: multicopper oxidase domain-containing protein, partial [Dongiaceae bacterium]|nr:multicopper oxidase domain-containing protein [Dongiaceae bacterium]
MIRATPPGVAMFSRRAFMMSAAAITGAGGLATCLAPGRAAADGPVTVLKLQRRTIEVNGKPASVYGIRQPDGTDGLTTAVGKTFRVRVENGIEAPSLIHWHGLTPPWQQDGVPGISGPPIPPGGSADYDFPLRFGGTFWMHSHQGLQEQLLMAAPLIIRDQRDLADQQEIVLVLADFSFTPPEEIFAALKKGGSMAMGGSGAGAATMAGGASSASASMAGMSMASSSGSSAASGAMAGGNMAMNSGAAGPDLNDVKYDAFLANDRTLADPEVVKVEPGGRVLLRIVNSSSMSNYHIDLGQLEGELSAVDGFPVAPVPGRRFPIAVAQRLEIRLAIPSGPAAYPVLAVLEGDRKQTGIVLQAGQGPVARIPDMAAAASPALNLALEGSLRASNPLAPRKADRIHTLNLTGEMAGYVWSLNGVAWTPAVPPLPISKGERVELVLVNKTPMPHPMHLHGHEYQVVEIDGTRFP